MRGKVKYGGKFVVRENEKIGEKFKKTGEGFVKGVVCPVK